MFEFFAVHLSIREHDVVGLRKPGGHELPNGDEWVGFGLDCPGKTGGVDDSLRGTLCPNGVHRVCRVAK